MTEIGSGLLNGVTVRRRDPVTTIESSGAGVGAATLSSSCAASSVCAKAGVAIMTAIADRLAKPKFGRKRDATSFILRIWIIPGFLLKADLAQLALPNRQVVRSEEHTSELQSLMRISYAVFCLKKKIHNT